MASKARSPVATLVERIARVDSKAVDELYGLEPVFEPSQNATPETAVAIDAFVERRCPNCGEVNGSVVDLTDASREFIEDCQVCCKPMRVTLDVHDSGSLLGVTTSRLED